MSLKLGLTVSAAEAARILGVHPQTVRRAIRSGKLPVVHLGSRKYRVPREAVLELARGRLEAGSS
jgi:excisionase family DNA binding protein